jgi:hypothetical protein
MLTRNRTAQGSGKMAGDSAAFRESPPVYAKLLVSRNGPGDCGAFRTPGKSPATRSPALPGTSGPCRKVDGTKPGISRGGDCLKAAVSALAYKWSAMLFPRQIAFPQVQAPVHSQWGIAIIHTNAKAGDQPKSRSWGEAHSPAFSPVCLRTRHSDATATANRGSASSLCQLGNSLG